ncbi:hypothetical protein B9Q04_08370 [Candidatus Marsarchaeota G2 archaeon BE_D]|jgi:hypothetical protein|uniref:Pyridoxamine 5'-phosphate oxidase N-terminal domain-containing protein n=1 Tax=Candidatus Marsarchaeota G2 archaeon BE_D TaxID=1978158 RepID=A0A2R6CAH3_9ARCH|nr:MAG: hypothetical protein B9Q04_08370 [Candidatus Marsarchaeota G2 archaeon BE_D]
MSGIGFPKRLYELIRSENPVRSNTVIILVTLDHSGYPRPCLLSPYQVVGGREPEEILVAVNPGSTTHSNLLERARCTLIFFTPPSAVYAKGEASKIRETSDGNTLFRVALIETKEDYSEVAPIITQPLFDDSKVKPRYIKTYMEISG